MVDIIKPFPMAVGMASHVPARGLDLALMNSARPASPPEECRSRDGSPCPESPLSPGSYRVAASPADDSRAPSPADDHSAPNSPPQPPAQPQPIRVTNFFINDILRPDFGQKHSRDIHGLSYKYQPAGLNLSGTINHANISPHSHRRYSDSDSEDYKGKFCMSQSSPGSYSNTSPSKADDRRTLGSPAGLKTEHGAPPARDNIVWPAWVYCTRYSDRPSSGPRSRKTSKKEKKAEDKRPRTAFTNEQLARLKREFDENRYLTEQRRQDLARELKLNESQIKIWFQNKRAKMKKSSGVRNGLALQLMAQGLYNHATNSDIDVESLTSN